MSYQVCLDNWYIDYQPVDAGSSRVPGHLISLYDFLAKNMFQVPHFPSAPNVVWWKMIFNLLKTLCPSNFYITAATYELVADCNWLNIFFEESHSE